jgi:hypothetical protein
MASVASVASVNNGHTREEKNSTSFSLQSNMSLTDINTRQHSQHSQAITTKDALNGLQSGYTDKNDDDEPASVESGTLAGNGFFSEVDSLYHQFEIFNKPAINGKYLWNSSGRRYDNGYLTHKEFMERIEECMSIGDVAYLKAAIESTQRILGKYEE